MSFRRIFIVSLALAAVFAVAPFVVTPARAAAEGPSIEGLKVSVWPEYDTPSVLVIYRGRLAPSVQLPATVRLRIPKGAKVSSTAEVDPSGGFQYDDAWRTHQVKPAGEDDELTYQTTFRDWQCELYLDKIPPKGRRDFDFNFEPTGAIGELLVEVQKPRRAEKFKVEPAGGKVGTDEQGFEVRLFSFTKLASDQRLRFLVSYEKADAQPSTGQTVGGLGARAEGGNSFLIVIGLLLVVPVGLFAFWRLRSAEAEAPHRAPPVKKRKKTATGRYCSGCGVTMKKSAKFCRLCGEKI